MAGHSFSGSSCTLFWEKVLICFDPVRFASEWIIDLSKRPGMQEDEFTSMPVAAVNKKIMIATRSGKALVVNPEKGIIEKTYDLETPVKFQPVINDGWILTSSKEGKLISNNTGDKSLTGWPMWSFNAAHNVVVE